MNDSTQLEEVAGPCGIELLYLTRMNSGEIALEVIESSNRTDNKDTDYELLESLTVVLTVICWQPPK